MEGEQEREREREGKRERERLLSARKNQSIYSRSSVPEGRRDKNTFESPKVEKRQR